MQNCFCLILVSVNSKWSSWCIAKWKLSHNSFIFSTSLFHEFLLQSSYHFKSKCLLSDLSNGFLFDDNILLINYFEWKVQVMIDKPGLFVKFIWDLLFVVFSLLQISFSSGSPIYWGTACSCEYDLTAFFFCVAVIALHGLWISYFLSSISLLLMSGQKNTFFLFSRRMWRLGDDSGSKFQNFIKVSLNLF